MKKLIELNFRLLIKIQDIIKMWVKVGKVRQLGALGLQ